METSPTQQLRIKSGILQRLIREYESYQQEIQSDLNRIFKLKTDGADGYSIRKQEQVLNETIMMVPNTRGRLQQAINNLSDFIKEIDCKASVLNTEEWKFAREVFEKAQEIVQ